MSTEILYQNSSCVSVKDCRLISYLKKSIDENIIPKKIIKIGMLCYDLEYNELVFKSIQRLIALENGRQIGMVKNISAPPLRQSNEIELSVIIPTYNRADSLKQCLCSIVEQKFDKRKFEVIVVNNNSTDHTRDICKQYYKFFPNFVEVIEPIPGLLAARHAGLRNSSAPILTYCDDDIVANPLWLATICRVFSEKQDVGLVGGNNCGIFEVPPPVWFSQFWQQLENFYVCYPFSLLQGIDSPQYTDRFNLIFGCNFSIRRSILEQAGGFTPDCMGNIIFQGMGETSVANWMKKHTNWKAYLHPDASVNHYMPSSRLTCEYIYKRSIYSSISNIYQSLRTNSKVAIFQKYDVNENYADVATVNKAGLYFGQKKYFNALLKLKKLRDWVCLPTYFGFESPPVEIFENHTEFIFDVSW